MVGKPSRPFEINHRLVLSLALPMTLAYLSTPLLGLVDTAVAGQFGDAAMIGGLAVGAILIDLVFTTFGFLRAGTTGMTAQALGREDGLEIQAMLIRAVGLGIVCGLIAIAAGPLILAAGLYFMEPSNAVAEATRAYFTIRIFSSPFALANYALLGWLIGLGKTVMGLALHLLLSGANILLSIYMGLHLQWGLEGIAYATLVAEALTALVGGVICFRIFATRDKPSRMRILNRPALAKFANLNTNIMVRSFALLFAFAFFTAQGARFGDTTLAANAILMQFFFVAGYFLDGQATAAEQLAGRAIGANYRAGFIRSIQLSSLWNFALAAAMGLVFLLAGEMFVDWLTVNPEVRQEARIYLPWVVVIPLAGVLAFQMDGVFMGATWSNELSKMMLVSLALYLLVWWITKEPLGNHGLWLALNAFLVFRGLTLAVRVPPKLRQTFG